MTTTIFNNSYIHSPKVLVDMSEYDVVGRIHYPDRTNSYR